jgi:hypothetical protein
MESLPKPIKERSHGERTVPVSELLRRPTAFLPFALSGAALVSIAVHIAIAGTAPQGDEGTAAHIWQLLIVLEVFAIGLFAIHWLPKAPRPAMLVTALHVVGMVAAMAPVAILRW